MLPVTKSICQITTVHPRYDVRIFQKICTSLASEYQVNLIVADGEGNEVINNITIYDVGLRNVSRVKRIFITSYKAYKKAIGLKCEVYHFHDPEFLFCALKLARKGMKVIYDVHEDVPKQILSKVYLNPLTKMVFSRLILLIENFISARLFAVISVTSTINERFRKINFNSLVINNYPDILHGGAIAYNLRNGICYIGIISRIRGIREIIKLLDLLDVTLHLVGEFESEDFKTEIINNQNWNKVVYYGLLPYCKTIEIIRKSKIGMVTLLPEPNHIHSQPLKMFEYMSASLPVIASDFPVWKDIIEVNNCGICVNPLDQDAISGAISYLLRNPGIAESMGKNGEKAVREKYNWNSEKVRLSEFYRSVFL